MGADGQQRLPPGVQPYDRLNGVRIGALAGGVVGIVPIIWWPAVGIGSMIVGALLGGAAGYFWERRDQDRR